MWQINTKPSLNPRLQQLIDYDAHWEVEFPCTFKSTLPNWLIEGCWRVERNIIKVCCTWQATGLLNKSCYQPRVKFPIWQRLQYNMRAQVIEGGLDIRWSDIQRFLATPLDTFLGKNAEPAIDLFNPVVFLETKNKNPIPAHRRLHRQLMLPSKNHQTSHVPLGKIGNKRDTPKVITQICWSWYLGKSVKTIRCQDGLVVFPIVPEYRAAKHKWTALHTHPQQQFQHLRYHTITRLLFTF